MSNVGKRVWRKVRKFSSREMTIATEQTGPEDHADRKEDRAIASRPGADSGEPTFAGGLSLDLSPRKVARVMTLIASALVLLSLISALVTLLGGPWVQLVNVDSDLSLPAWYSALTLLFASILLAVIAHAKRGSENSIYVRHWAILAAIFLFLCCDEMLRLHERMALSLLLPSLEALGYTPSGIFYYSWTLVYLPLLVVFCLAYLRFWKNLPARIRSLFLAAGTVFVGGAIGVEMFGSWYESTFGQGGAVLLLAAQVEELMEMVGVIIFVYALMTYLASHLRVGELRIHLSPSAPHRDSP